MPELHKGHSVGQLNCLLIITSLVRSFSLINRNRNTLMDGGILYDQIELNLPPILPEVAKA